MHFSGFALNFKCICLCPCPFDVAHVLVRVVNLWFQSMILNVHFNANQVNISGNKDFIEYFNCILFG